MQSEFCAEAGVYKNSRSGSIPQIRSNFLLFFLIFDLKTDRIYPEPIVVVTPPPVVTVLPWGKVVVV